MRRALHTILDVRACTCVIEVKIPQLTTSDQGSALDDAQTIPVHLILLYVSSKPDPRSIDDMQVANLPESAMDQGSELVA